MSRRASLKVWILVWTVASLLSDAAVRASSLKPPVLGVATRHAKSARLSGYRAVGPVMPGPQRERPNEVYPKKGSGLSRPASDPAVQTRFGLSQPEPLLQFEGASEADNTAVVGHQIVPPDTEGDVGPNHYFQYINNVATIYDKNGQIVLGPFAGNAFWSGLGGPCEVQNDGDPLVRYDRQADRWVVSQFALPNFPAGPFYQCFAVSTTSDPTGDYWQYEFKTSDDFFTDYGKLGIWPDAYYVSFNMFGPNGEVQGGAYAFDRASMLTGAPAGMIAFDTGDQTGALPSDLDGATPPPAGSPNYFMTFDVNPSRLLEWQFHVDWTTPANSTLTGPVEIPVADFLYPVCDADRSQCVPQFETSEKLETLDHTLMYRLVYRNFGDHESLVVNHTVGTAAGGAAPRWYEIRNPGNSPTIHQQGTYAPDPDFRWMGSIAMDGNGNIALGYSKSSASTYPSIAITGRLAGDPLGTMGAEDVWLSGAGSQFNSASRWGDYSTMSIDPVDDCTFWYTQEYYQETGSFNFKTRVGSFRFPSCTSGPAGTLAGTVTDGSNPIEGATVTATPSGGALAGASSTTTDASGHYQFLTLPAGTYDVAAARYPYVPSTAQGVIVASGGSATQDFTLSPGVTNLVVGTVKDGSGQGWPLYAKVVISGPVGFPVTTVLTDATSGAYSVDLAAGFTYDFAVTSLVPGYAPGGGPLNIPAAPASAVVANWSLAAAPSCTAPGYGPGNFAGPLVLSEGFGGGVIPAGWNVETPSGVSWKVYTAGDPCFQFDGNRTGGSGPYAIVNSGCETQFTTDDTRLVTPPMDLSGKTSAAIQWANDFIDQNSDSVASVDVSADGGATWTNVWQATTDIPGPGLQIADMSFAAGHANVRARFHYQGFFSWWWQVDDVKVGTFACSAVPGGLIVGRVTDANTGAGLNGAEVSNPPDGDTTTTGAAGEGPQADGFYSLFSKDGGSQSFSASFPLYDTLTKTATVIPNGTVRVDFALPAGLLTASPTPLSITINPGAAQNRTLTLANIGTADAQALIQEINGTPVNLVPPANRPVADPLQIRRSQRRVGFEHADDRHHASAAPAPSGVPALVSAGAVVRTFPTGLSSGWGLAYDTKSDRLWISNPDNPDSGFSGDGFEHAFLPDGTPTPGAIDLHDSGGSWQADGTFNARTGMLWQVNVGGDRCLFEMDPAAQTVTGRRICGPWDSSQHAVAYDYATDTYYVGGFNDGAVYHLDGSGNLIDSKYVGIGIVGLAFNPTTRHLFIASEGASPYNVWVVSPDEDYAFLGGFQITVDGIPLADATVSLEASCDGRLFAVDEISQVVYEFESGETGWCVNDIPWLTKTPDNGSVPQGGNLPVTVAFDPTGLLPGLRLGSLIFTTDTPTGLPPVPVQFTLLFNDVPEGIFAWNYIYGAAGAGVMPGCAPQTPTYTFCPAEVVTRRSMAGFIERAMHGALTPPPVYLGEFDDVLAGSFNANYIQGLVEDRVTAGCSVAPPLYCPDVPVTRAQMAVFVWKALNGDAPPPSCTGVFADVPCPGGFAVDYIEGIAAAGITAGCGGADYCPDASITNAQMAVFLVKAFEIPYVP